MSRKKLREYDHPYYCNDANYFSNDCFQSYGAWGDFVAAEGDADEDLNYLIRWDWESGTLKFYFVGQRKGLFRVVHVSVHDGNEADVRSYLKKKWLYVKRLWEPVSGEET